MTPVETLHDERQQHLQLSRQYQAAMDERDSLEQSHWEPWKELRNLARTTRSPI